MKLRVIKAALSAGIFLTASLPAEAWAQQAPDAGDIADIVVRQNEIIEEYSVPPPRGRVRLSVTDMQQRMPQDAAQQVTFVLQSVTVEGATLLPPSQFAPLWKHLVGKQVRLSDLYAIPERIEAAYSRSGTLAMAVVPEQDVSDGHIRIVVYDQSYIGKIELKMDRPGLRARLAPYLDRIAAMRPLHIAGLERQLLLMSDLAGMGVEATLTRPEQPGEGGSLALELSFTPWAAQVGLNNRGSDSVGPLQLSANYVRNDLLGLFETSSLTGVTIPDSPRELLFGQVAQDIPFGNDGLRVGYSLGYARSRPGGELADANVRVKTLVGDVHATYPFLRTINNSIYGDLRLQLSNTDIDVMGAPQTRERARWLALGVNSEHAFERGSAAWSMAVLQGLEFLGATDSSSDLAGRIGGKPDFRIWQADAALTLRPAGMVVLTARGSAQYAFDPVPAAVRFGVGGDPFGRAFDATAIQGDSGIAASLEVALNDLLHPAGAHLSPFAFVDHGTVWNRGDLLDFDRASIASTGVGIRAAFATRTMVEATLALPIHESGEQFDDGLRLFFQVGQMF